MRKLKKLKKKNTFTTIIYFKKNVCINWKNQIKNLYFTPNKFNLYLILRTCLTWREPGRGLGIIWNNNKHGTHVLMTNRERAWVKRNPWWEGLPLPPKHSYP